MFEIEFYRLPDGKKPVKEFLDSLEPKMRAKALYSLSVLEEFGNALREPYSKPVGDGLLELRIKFASDITRIFYFFIVGNRIILTNGFVKKSVRTPPNEIKRAKEYKNDYERRHGHE
ncbi:MAG: type II toxin-antitoxin system RelE/ParE family toxin [Oscillospiraceae bacterium]|nr:type II toxin-antitoxin system RelE/ParE family toxin [Oscillospiraceae bacterium]